MQRSNSLPHGKFAFFAHEQRFENNTMVFPNPRTHTMIYNFIDKVRLPFRKEKAFIASLYEILGFYPHQLEIYHIALAHKSNAYRNQKGRTLNNERLEFLGDAILEAIVSDIVYHRYERKKEGFLTSTRSKLVQRSTLNKLAAELHLDRLLHYSAQPGVHNSYICGNAFEALIGAIYLDRGYHLCKWFVENRLIGKLIDIDGVAQQEVNFKSKLLEWSQKNRIQVNYEFETTEKEGSNSPVFRSYILIEGLQAGEGSGFSKKESQQKAAKEALTKLRKEPQFVENIFKAKEGRTAMEAPEICAVPAIDFHEEEVSSNLLLQETEGNKGQPKKRKRAHGKAQRAPQTNHDDVALKDTEISQKQPQSPPNPPVGETVPTTEGTQEEGKKERGKRPYKRRSYQGKKDEHAPQLSKEELIRSAEEQAFKEYEH